MRILHCSNAPLLSPWLLHHCQHHHYVRVLLVVLASGWFVIHCCEWSRVVLVCLCFDDLMLMVVEGHTVAGIQLIGQYLGVRISRQ